ncbi:MAG: histidine kinase, partial [Anaerolineae bacterium]|nr:histidine kinase [Anaerolineae bacterium]
AYTCDPDGLITYFNQQAVQLWGRAPALNDPVDRFCGSFKLFSRDGTPINHDQCWMALALKTNQGYNQEEIIVERPDGQRRTVLAYANPIHDEAHKLLGAVNILVDITERREIEAAKRLLADMRERNHLAQELHDTVAQALGYLNLKIGMTHTALASGHVDTALANLEELKQVIGETYTDVREEIFNLRTKVQSGLGFLEVLDRYIEKYHRFYHLDIDLLQEADPALFEFRPEVTSQLIRIIQEALINVRKHAQVKTAIIRLGQEDGQIRISIEDQGQGFDWCQTKKKTASFGLQIMQERVESVGGRLEVDTTPGQGTRVIVWYKDS